MDPGTDTSIGALFLSTADEHRERIAVRSPVGAWTYGELATLVRSRAGAIIDTVGAESTPVAVLAAHDGDLVAAILSIITAGHIVVVLDPQLPAAQLHHILAECSPPLLLHDDAHTDLAAQLRRSSLTSLRTISLDGMVGQTDQPLPTRGPQDPIMLAFTSGTSGPPKAAIITHGVLLNLVRGATRALGIGPDDRLPMLFPVSLAVAAYPMFLPLLNGGSLATLDVRSLGLAPIGDFLVDERITVAYLAPTVVRFLVDALEGREFPDLRLVALGGEPVDAEVVDLTERVFSPGGIANGYGTTETGIIALQVVDTEALRSGENTAVPAGVAVTDVELTILDDHGIELPAGDPGEIAVTSPYLFHGYWGHPELNRQVLSADPQGRPNWRRYRTGDFGILDESGALVVTGRIDTKVKIRGRFVVLGDVETELRGLDEIDDAAVTAHTRSGVTELVAYVVAATTGSLDTIALRARMLETTESYRIPSRWVVLDELPRLPNGKTDRRALPSPEIVEGPLVHSAFSLPVGELPRGENERVREVLRSIWQTILPIGAVGLDEDFFHLGGDSLLAAQMLVMAEQQLGLGVPMGELIHARTVRELAEVVVRLESRGDAPASTVSCVQLGDESTRPRLWFVHDLQGSAYRIRHLASHLGEDQPVWSFESPLLAGARNPFTTLDTFAARYLTDLRHAQPEGPYWLAGYSFGGICAYEMARQLRREGAEVSFLAVVDVGPGYRGPGWHGSHSPLRPWFGIAKPAPDDASLIERVRYYREMVRTSPSGAARHLMVRTGLFRWIDPIRFRADLQRQGRIRPEWRLWYSWEEHWKLAATAWDRTRPYEGRLDLLWADESPASDATMGWGPLVGELEIRRFGGDHIGVLEERGAALLGPVLRDAIDQQLERVLT